jgi:hypothetical protein
MNSKVPTGTEILSHETKIFSDDVFRMINKYTTHFHSLFTYAFHSLKRPFERCPYNFSEPKNSVDSQD